MTDTSAAPQSTAPKKGRTLLLVTGALVLVAIIAALGFWFAAFDRPETTAGIDSEATETTVIRVGASPTPHAEILAEVVGVLGEEGIELEIVEYTDYVLPNSDLESGEIDANYFQHVPYLDEFNAENGTRIVAVASIHFEPLGLYPGKVSSIDDLADGAKIAVPNDATNEARALLLLEAEGLLKLKKDAGLTATINDIVENPKNIEFIEVEAAATPSTLKDVDLAVINGNYALAADLEIGDALAGEATDSLAAETYANIVAVKAGSEDDPAVKALVEALSSARVRQFIEERFGGSVVALI